MLASGTPNWRSAWMRCERLTLARVVQPVAGIGAQRGLEQADDVVVVQRVDGQSAAVGEFATVSGMDGSPRCVPAGSSLTLREGQVPGQGAGRVVR